MLMLTVANAIGYLLIVSVPPKGYIDKQIYLNTIR